MMGQHQTGAPAHLFHQKIELGGGDAGHVHIGNDDDIQILTEGRPQGIERFLGSGNRNGRDILRGTNRACIPERDQLDIQRKLRREDLDIAEGKPGGYDQRMDRP
ncbi:MAG: hypothetical protein AMXMBFR82_36070 [Candidatus Hydrogenedentota bacterium]